MASDVQLLQREAKHVELTPDRNMNLTYMCRYKSH